MCNANTDYKSLPAKWNFTLHSTSLVGYKKGQHLVISSIYTGRLGAEASQKYGLEIKIDSWGKPFKSSFESPDKKTKEVFTVTLYELPDLNEMKAEFEDVVYENSNVKLKFSGVTILSRVN